MTKGENSINFSNTKFCLNKGISFLMFELVYCIKKKKKKK